jgi:hypothetical protein
MAHRATAEPRQAYLVEHYRPGVCLHELEYFASRVRDTVAEMEREGKQVGYLRSMIVPGDEYFVALLDAASEGLVREVYTRAGITFERISTAISLEKT